jgi:hypothetical protein
MMDPASLIYAAARKDFVAFAQRRDQCLLRAKKRVFPDGAANG